MDADLTVLLVEDDAAHVELIAAAFEESPWPAAVRHAPDIRAARRAIASEPPDVVVADWRLPDGHGTDLLAEGPALQGPPLILMTSFGDEQLAVQAIKSGAMDYLVKSEDAFLRMPRVVRRVLAEWRNRVARARAEAELRRSEENLREALRSREDIERIINLSPVTVWRWRNEAGWPVAFVSDNVGTLGYAPETFLSGRISFFSILHPADRDRVIQEIAGRAGAAETVSFAMEYRIRAADGGIRHMDARTWIQRDEAGRIAQYHGILLDVTDRIEAQADRAALAARLQHAQKMESIGNLAGGIAHDFNNILSCVLGYAELALEDLQQGSPLTGHLQEITAAGKRAKDLVNQILVFARRSEEKQEPVRIDITAKEVLRFIRSTIPANIEIRQEISSRSTVMANLTQMHQILMNLCSNAAYAMEARGGTLTVRLSDVAAGPDDPLVQSGLKPGRYVALTVADTGIGIPEAAADAIFEPYFTTKPQGEGTGLGLSLVYGIVESCGGRINVESRLGEGASFHIYLPVAAETQTRSPEAPEALPGGTERVLVVDDEHQVADIVQQTLERLGYAVTACNSSVSALALFRAAPRDFDLVLTDMTMPGMTGDVLSRELMAIRPDIPIILCTGYSRIISDEIAAEIGIRAFAYKPIIRADLARTVRTVLDRAG